MSEFHSEVRSRAQLARQATKRKGGSKSRKCGLPSDHLTPAQRAKLNGPVKTYRFTPDVPEEELATWPADLREEYQKMFRR